MPPLPRLFCDVDGTLAFQPEGDILALNAKFGSALLVSDATRYPFRKMLPPQQAAWLEANRAVICANLAPDTIAIGVLRKFAKAGGKLSIVTERPPELQALTRAWLKYWDVPGADDAQAVGPGGKAALLADRDGWVLIDDDPDKAKLVRTGTEVWQPARPWNDGSGGVWRFESWRDVKKKLGL